MLKKTIIAGFALVIATFAFQPVTNADAKVRIHIGIGALYDDPYYGGGYNRDPYYRGYEPRYRPVPLYRPKPRTRRVNCRQAKRILQRRGFYRIRVGNCRGKRYRFTAKRRGAWYNVRMHARNGDIFSIRRR